MSEYKVVKVGDSQLEARLNELAAEGWSLKFILPIQQVFTNRLILERNKSVVTFQDINNNVLSKQLGSLPLQALGVDVENE